MVLSLPESDREVTFLQMDLSKAPAKKTGMSWVLDDWVESINQVIEYLQKNPA